MTEHLAYSLTSASLGFIAAACFCIGSSFLSKNKIIILSKTYWSYNIEQAKAKVSQSAQYLTGGIFLVSSFFLQVVAIQASEAQIQMIHPSLESVPLFISLVLSSGAIVAFCLFRLLMLREKSILKELQKTK